MNRYFQQPVCILLLNSTFLRTYVQLFFSFLLAFIPCTILAAPQVAGSQQAKDVQVERYMVQAMTKSFLGHHEEAISLYQKALDLSPTSPVIHSALADEYDSLENLSTAIYHASQARDYAPENPHFHRQLATLYTDQKDLLSAEQTLQKMLEQFPESIEALEDLAYLQFSSGQYEKALQSYKNLESKLGPTQHISYRLLQVHYQLNDVEGVERALIALENLNPENATIKRNLAELYIEYGRTQEAINILESALSIDSLDIETIVPLAQIYQTRGESQKADALLKRATQVTGSPEDAYARASHLYERADENAETLEIVKGLLKYAIDQDPAFAEALVLLGTIRFEEHAFEEAGAMLYEAVQINPKNPEVWLQAAAAYLRTDQPKQAADIADEALLLFPGQISLLRVAAFGYLDSYQNRQSIAHFQEFYELIKEEASQQREQIEILSALGLLYTRTQDYKASDEAYERALNISSDNVIVLNNFAYSLSEREVSLDKALSMAQKAVKLSPDNPSFMDTLGWVYFKQGDYQKAQNWIRRAIEAGASSAATFEHMGDIQVMLGETNAAVSSWKKALELSPNNNTLQEKINNID